MPQPNSPFGFRRIARWDHISTSQCRNWMPSERFSTRTASLIQSIATPSRWTEVQKRRSSFLVEMGTPSGCNRSSTVRREGLWKGLRMSLADEIRALRDRSLADLSAVHDYFTETKRAWRIVRKVIRSGRKFTIHNSATGTVTAGSLLAEKATKYVAGFLAETPFKQFVAIFENYFFDLL